jgi:glycosyltransferase involved in cell wall biosynthesis
MTNQISPTISVVTATYNCAHTAAECLASVAEQVYPYREHVVVDGASTDSTMAILTAHAQQLAVLKSEPDAGIYDALNKGIALARGDVIGFLHADDLYANPNVLAQIAKAFEDPALCAVYGDLQYVTKTNTAQVVRKWRSSPFTPNLLAWGWMPPHPTLYVRREWYERIGGFDTRYRIAADYLSILQMFSQADFKSVYLPKVLVKMRLGGESNKSLKNLVRKTAEDWRALRSTGVGALGGAWALVWKNLSKLGQFR